MKLLVKMMFLLLMASLAIGPAWAQVETGTITGTVRDTSGAAVAGATVTAHKTGFEQRCGWGTPRVESFVHCHRNAEPTVPRV
jgi:hypothetical protein